MSGSDSVCGLLDGCGEVSSSDYADYWMAAAKCPAATLCAGYWMAAAKCPLTGTRVYSLLMSGLNYDMDECPRFL